MYISLIDSHGFFFFLVCVLFVIHMSYVSFHLVQFFLEGGGWKRKTDLYAFFLITGHDQFLLQIIIFFFAKYGKTSL